MARLRATIQGRRGEASRLGDEYITAKVNSWQRHVAVQMADDSDCEVEISPYSHYGQTHAECHVWMVQPERQKGDRSTPAKRRKHIEQKFNGTQGQFGGEQWSMEMQAGCGEGIHVDLDPATGEYTIRLIGKNGILLPPLASGRLGGHLQYTSETHEVALLHLANTEKAEQAR